MLLLRSIHGWARRYWPAAKYMGLVLSSCMVWMGASGAPIRQEAQAPVPKELQPYVNARSVVNQPQAEPSFFLIDMSWLGVGAKDFYKRHLGYLMRPQVNWAAAISFYFLFIIGIVIFAVKPGLEMQSPMRALVYGALFGFFTYAT